MIPEFPKFKKLELADEEEIRDFTKNFPPYSDFNFISMYSWDVNEKMKISTLNSNLVVLFQDYMTNEYLLSFMGDNEVNDTIAELIKFSKKEYGVEVLDLIPQELLDGLDTKVFSAKPDRGSFDYIFSVAHLANMNNWAKKSSAKRIRRFLKEGLNFEIKEQLIGEIDRGEYKKLFIQWAKNNNIDDHFELNEYQAFERFLKLRDKNIRFVSLFIDDKLVGFTSFEILSDDFAISHFAKTDTMHHRSALDVLNWEEAKILESKGIKYFNWEQDLGLKGLRTFKEGYKPAFFLEKFVVRCKM